MKPPHTPDDQDPHDFMMRVLFYSTPRILTILGIALLTYTLYGALI